VGDKGAKAFVQKYGELGILDNALILEECGDGEEILIVLKDMHKAVYDMEIIEKIQRSHAKVKDVNSNILPLRSGRLIIG